MKKLPIFTIKEDKIENAPRTWNSTLATIFKDGERIGEFIRNYDSYTTQTFAPFRRNNKWYALYSPNYTTIRIMDLETCKDIGGLEPGPSGFCPVEIVVPRFRVCKTIVKEKPTERKSDTRFEVQYETELDDEPHLFEYDDEAPHPPDSFWAYYGHTEGVHHSNYALAQGCVWGDDNSWKLCLYDISEAHNGIIKIPQFEGEEKLLYKELPNGKILELVKLRCLSSGSTEEEALKEIGFQLEVPVVHYYRMRDNQLIDLTD